jgi:hypothetical protein
MFGIKSDEQKELERIVCKLNDEENKKCLEVMVFLYVGRKNPHILR